MRMRAFCLLCLFFFAVVATAAEEKKPKIAVMEIEDSTGVIPSAVLGNATEMLRGLLTSSGSFVVIDKSRQREKIQEMVKDEKKESWKECYDQSCRIQLGQSLAADSILRTTISCLGKECYFSSELVDLAKEANVGGGTAGFVYDEKDMKGLKAALESVVAQIVTLAKNLAVEREARLKSALEAEQKRQENEARLQEEERKRKMEEEKALEAEVSGPPKEGAAGKGQPVTAKEPEVRRPYLWYGIGTIIGGVALAVGGGAGFGLMAKDRKDAYTEKMRTENIDAAVASGVPRDEYLSDARRIWDDSQTFGALEYSFIGVGGAAVVAGIILAVWPEKSGTVKTVGVVPVPGGFVVAAGFEF